VAGGGDDRVGAVDGLAGPQEGGQEAVAAGPYLAASVALEVGPHHRPVGPEQLLPGPAPGSGRGDVTTRSVDRTVTDLDSWLGEPEEPQPHRQSVLFTKVVVALLAGRSAKHFLDVQRARHLDTMKALTTARRNAATTQDALLADFRLFHLEADLRWIDHTESRLAALAEEVRDVPDPRRR
jgi:hypothetical protein